MKIIPFLLALFMLNSLNLIAQGPERDFKKIEAYKIQYLTEKLDLSPELAQKFWPVYNEYQKETRRILKGKPDLPPRGDDGRKMENMTDEEIETFVLEKLNDQKQLAELKILYYEKFKAAIGTRGAAKYYRAELDFHRRLMDELQRRRKKRP
jgi:hypothetical protein